MKQLLLLVIAIVFYCPIIAQIPTNDLIQNATLVDQAPFVENNLRLDLASASAGGQQNCNLNGFQVVYYKFTATNDNEITITIEDTYGYAIGQSLAIVYSAPNLNQTDETQLTGVSTCQYGSVTNFVPTIGVSYYILVHRINGGTIQSKVTIDIPQDASVTERNALIDLYNSAGGTNWTNNNNWTFSDPISSWYGVTVKNGQVTNIDLNSNNLNGTIPASISNLSNLEEINLSNNSISGTIPDFSLIPTITTVNVNNNNLSFDGLETNYANNSTISSFMYQTQNKTDAQMEFNGTIGNNYNFIMTSVNGTNVQYQWYKKRFNYFVPSDEVINGATSNTLNINNLQGSDMDMYICRATSASIPDLVIERNSIEIKGPVSQTQKNALIALYNSTNGASWTNNTNWLSAQPVSEWHGVTVVGNRVTELDFGSNNLTGTLPPEIGDLTGLEFLSFYYGNNIGGTLPPEIGNLTELRVISIEYNSFTGGIPSTYANLTKLRGFWFNNNMLSGTIPNFVITSYPNLVYFDISVNNFEGPLPDFTSLPHIRYISIGNNYFAANDFSAQFNDYLNLQSSWNNNYYYSPQKTKDSGGAQNGHVGDNITLTATNNSSSRISSRSSQAADTYQWFKDNVQINGATSSSYTITNAQISDSGTYHCEIYNTDVPDLIVLRPSIALNIGVLGIDDKELNNINLYPNPARDVINIKVNANSFGSVSLFDIRGRVILNKDLSSQISTINISNLNTGIYLLKFKTKYGLITKRIIKK